MKKYWVFDIVNIIGELEVKLRIDKYQKENKTYRVPVNYDVPINHTEGAYSITYKR